MTIRAIDFVAFKRKRGSGIGNITYDIVSSELNNAS